MKGCPLKVTVSSTVDASKIICSGEGLKWGILGKEIKSFIDTRNSGPGKLIDFAPIFLVFVNSVEFERVNTS